MTSWGWAEWIAWAGLVLPLGTLAASAAGYVLSKHAEEKHRQFERFFNVMNLAGAGDSIASKMAAFYELRKYPEYKDVIVRLCEKAEVTGPAAQMLSDEMQLTADYMRRA